MAWLHESMITWWQFWRMACWHGSTASFSAQSLKNINFSFSFWKKKNVECVAGKRMDSEINKSFFYRCDVCREFERSMVGLYSFGHFDHLDAHWPRGAYFPICLGYQIARVLTLKLYQMKLFSSAFLNGLPKSFHTLWTLVRMFACSPFIPGIPEFGTAFFILGILIKM